MKRRCPRSLAAWRASVAPHAAEVFLDRQLSSISANRRYPKGNGGHRNYGIDTVRVSAGHA